MGFHGSRLVSHGSRLVLMIFMVPAYGVSCVTPFFNINVSEILK